MSDIERIERKRQERIEEFAHFGIEACERGTGVAGSIAFHATQAEKLLRLLRKMRRDAKKDVRLWEGKP